LKGAWFQTLTLEKPILVSKRAFKEFNPHVELCLTHSLKGAWFQTLTLLKTTNILVPKRAFE
jgi:hypothetical protein